VSPDDLGDRRAVNAFLRGRDDSAFDVLYERHTPKLMGLALRLSSGDEGLAAEIAQEAWVRALPQLDGFRWRSSLSTWLCAFVVNVWREESRRRARSGGDWEVAEQCTAGVAETPGLGLDVTRAVDGLAPGFRSVLLLYGVYGYSHDEIGKMLGISPGTSKSQLSRARVALRRALGR